MCLASARCRRYRQYPKRSALLNYESLKRFIGLLSCLRLLWCFAVILAHKVCRVAEFFFHFRMAILRGFMECFLMSVFTSQLLYPWWVGRYQARCYDLWRILILVRQWKPMFFLVHVSTIVQITVPFYQKSNQAKLFRFKETRIILLLEGRFAGK